MDNSANVVLRGLRARVQCQIEAALFDKAHFEAMADVWGGDTSQNPGAYVLATVARRAASERLEGLRRIMADLLEADGRHPLP